MNKFYIAPISSVLCALHLIVTNLMKLKIKRNSEYNLKMHVKLCIANILDLRIKIKHYDTFQYVGTTSKNGFDVKSAYPANIP